MFKFLVVVVFLVGSLSPATAEWVAEGNAKNSSSSCSGYTSCTSCTAATGAGLGCSWCPLDGTCHDYGSILNKCNTAENIHNASLCGCSPPSCSPSGTTPTSNCSWYTDGSPDPGQDPATWQGGDFLPDTYASAASCACSGAGNPLWLSGAAYCVRSYLMAGHQALPDETKWAMRNATLSAYPFSEWQAFIPMIYQMHEDAYSKCCCSGTVAPFAFWEGIFFAGNLLPCSAVVPAVLTESRCGCGF